MIKMQEKRAKEVTKKNIDRLAVSSETIVFN